MNVLLRDTEGFKRGAAWRSGHAISFNILTTEWAQP
jgi:hypothetical protein